MEITLFVNNWLGWQVAKWLRWEQHEVVNLAVVHPPETGKFLSEIKSAMRGREVFLKAPELRTENGRKWMSMIHGDIGISAGFGYILSKEIIDMFPMGIVNLHPAYLPHNKGWNPNVYPFIDGSPAGVAIHYMNEGIDSGPIIDREKVEVLSTDTGGILHQRLTRKLLELFKKNWPKLRMGTELAFWNNPIDYPVHYRKDMREIEHINLDDYYLAGHLINIIRGNTYPPYPSAYFVDDDGQKIYMRMQLLREKDLEGGLPSWE